MEAKVPTIRELMPDGFLRLLLLRTKTHQAGYLSNIVLTEAVNSKHWHAVETLAKENNPEGYARWKASQPESVNA